MTAWNVFMGGFMTGTVILGTLAITNGISRAVIGESWQSMVNNQIGKVNPF